MSVVLEGKSIYSGISIGKILFYGKNSSMVRRDRISDAATEIKRFEKAKSIAVSQLRELYQKAVKEVGEINAQIFEVHSMMLEDDDFNDSVKHIIEGQKVNAEYAVAATGDNFSEMFAQMEDEYFRARAADVKDISERLIAVLAEKEQGGFISEKCIVMAEELAPSETVQMDKQKLLGFVTRLGSANSHTAILARTMNIPALVGVRISEEYNGKTAVLDGFSGKLIVDPDEETLEKYRLRMDEERKKKEMLLKYKGRETINKNGKKIHLYANIGGSADIASVLSNDAEGIGLFRSEFLYLEADDYPSEEIQFHAYKQVAETMVGKKVIIRTLDIGADKKVDYFGLADEENPAMGYRAIRICLTREDIFRTQLRAILRAGVYGNIAVMYPMIISVDEVRRIKEIVKCIEKELEEAGIEYGKVEQGIMIETPAAALISDKLAKEVDFFSIGTNDLTQYTLAIDRQNPELDNFFDAHHDAVLRLIKMTVENGHREGIWVGICGELGADLTLTDAFMDIGIDELSVSPSKILAVREAIINGK